MSGLLVVGLSHKSAPVELRERYAAQDAEAALEGLRDLTGEAAVLATCNRFELYAAGAEPDVLLDWLARQGGMTGTELSAHAYVRAGRNAYKHLFFVATSLDSLVVGETQIRNQVKGAYRRATEADLAGPCLHAAFQEALRVSKEIADRTGVGRGTVSVAGAAADLAERVFGELSEARVLVAGAGETAELVMQHLASRGVTSFHVVNRTVAHAQELADRFAGRADGLDQLAQNLVHTDVLIAAAGGDRVLVTARDLRAALKQRRGRPIVAIDIAMPRAIDPDSGVLDNIYRYDMEALAAVTRDGLRHRRKDFLQCCTMIDAATLRLMAGQRAQAAGDAIRELEDSYRQIASDELEALERRVELETGQREEVRRAVRRILRKLLSPPVRRLREADPEESEVLRRALPRRRPEA